MSKLSPKEIEEVKKESKQIMDSFMNKLESVEGKLKNIDVGVEREDFERREGSGSFDDSFDRDVMFSNAPKKDLKKGVIIGEKKGW